jgi:hypothetical protein
LNIECVPVFGRGKKWHRSFINRLLENETVLGTLTPHTMSYVSGKMVRVPQAPVQDYYPAVVDPIVFHRVQSQRSGARSPMRGKNASEKVSNIFGGGMARCGRCGASLVRVNKGNSKGRSRGVSYLVCSAAKTGAGCIYETVPYQRAEDAFLTNVRRLVARAPAGDKNNRRLDKEIETLESSIYGTDDALDRLLDSLAASRSPAVERRIRELETELESLKAQLTQLYEQRADTAGPLVRSRLDDLLEAATTDPLNRTHLNALLRQNLSRIELNFDSQSLTLLWKQGGEGQVQFGFPKK